MRSGHYFNAREFDALVRVRRRNRNHPDDLPAMRAVIEAGEIRWRVLSATELLDELIASCIGDVE